MPPLRRAAVDEPTIDGANAWTTTDGRVLYGRRDGEDFRLWCPGVAVFGFRPAGPVEYDAADDDDAGHVWLRSALPLVVEARGLPVLHASAVSRGSDCVVVCGRSTAGKSTLAAAASRVGLRVESDDAIAFAASGGAMVARTLPFEVRLRPPADEALGPISVDGDGGRELRLAYLILLEPDAQTDGVQMDAVSPAAAFGSLMPHAYCFSLDDSKDRIVLEYTSLVENVPVQRLRYRPEHASLPAMVDELGALLA